MPPTHPTKPPHPVQVEKELRDLREESKAAHKMLDRSRENIFPAFFSTSAFGNEGLTTSNNAETLNSMLIPARKQATFLGSLLSTHHTLEVNLQRKVQQLPPSTSSSLIPQWVRTKARELHDRIRKDGWSGTVVGDVVEVQPAARFGHRQLQVKVAVQPSPTVSARPTHDVLGGGGTGSLAFSQGAGHVVTLCYPDVPADATLGMESVRCFSMQCSCGFTHFTRVLCVHALVGFGVARLGRHWQLFLISAKPWLSVAAWRQAVVPSTDEQDGGDGGRVAWHKVLQVHEGEPHLP